MIAGNGEDGRVVVAVGIVELLGIVLLLAEVVDHVAKMKEEGGQASGIGLAREVGGHGIGDSELRLGANDASGIADGMKDELAGGQDLGGRIGAED